jgi:hypothetical protein
MELQNAVHHVFIQLSDSLEKLHPSQYSLPCKNLSGNTIGQHVRHIIEMFQCLEQGWHTGEVDYEARKRDRQIETDPKIALVLLKEIEYQISKENRALCLLTRYEDLQEVADKINTNYHREIAYNLEHTIHHMALIRIGLKELGEIEVEDSYGVASSTLKYRKQCAQ